MLADMKNPQLPKLTAKVAEEMLTEYRGGAKLSVLLDKYEIAESTFFRWKRKYDGLSADEISKVRKLEKKNQALERRIKSQEIEIRAIKAALRKKF